LADRVFAEFEAAVDEPALADRVLADRVFADWVLAELEAEADGRRVVRLVAGGVGDGIVYSDGEDGVGVAGVAVAGGASAPVGASTGSGVVVVVGCSGGGTWGTDGTP